MTDLKVLANLPSIPEQFTEKKLIELFEQVSAEVTPEVYDLETEEGRKLIKANAKKVASSKTAIDKPLRDYLRELKALPKEVERIARENLERFNGLQAEIIKPLEEAQAEQDDILAYWASMPTIATTMCMHDALVAHSETEELDVNEIFWKELQKKAKAAKEAALLVLTNRISQLEQAAEIERLRLEAEEARKQQELAEMQRQAEERARQENLQAIARAEQEKAAAIEAQKQAEQRAIFEAEQAKEREAKALEAAKLQAEQAAERAIEEEKARQEAEARRQAEEAAKREADKNHRASINREILADLMAIDCNDPSLAPLKLGQFEITPEIAKAVIIMIARGNIRNTKINY